MRNGYADPGDLVAYNRSGNVVMGIVQNVTRSGVTHIECIEEGYWKGKLSRVKNPGSVRVILTSDDVRSGHVRIAGLS